MVSCIFKEGNAFNLLKQTMKLYYFFPLRMHFLIAFSSISIFSASGHPVSTTTDSKSKDYTNAGEITGSNYVEKQSINCHGEQQFDLRDAIFLNNSDVFLRTKNITIHSSDYYVEGERIYACITKHESRFKPITDCKDKFTYESDEFDILPNKSALLFGNIIEPGSYELKGNRLIVCALDYDSDYDFGKNNSVSSQISYEKVSIYVGKIGSSISIVALVAHLFMFCFVPTLRNLPGYNLASLSVAFLFGYSFLLIGQIPEVLGLFCVVSGALQQNFFLAAFFWMNVLAFDVWRTLKLATEKFIVGSNNVRKRQFMWYSTYAWGCPLVVTSVSVILDNIDGIPVHIKPYFGRDDTCWMTNKFAKLIFFAIPSFTLVMINVIFFLRSSMIISNNTMKCTNEQQKQSVKLNYVLYVRLALMMGLTWLIGVIALISKVRLIWFIHDIFNCLQGLFMFLLFTCTRKVVKHLKEKLSSKKFSTEKHSSCISKLDSH